MSLTFARGWTGLCATLVVLGWGLSALRVLQGAGYAVGLLLAVALWWGLARGWPPQFGRWPRRRWRRPLPLAFLLLLAGVVLGGILYAPNNFDALAYRVPRTALWLQAHGWHWLDAPYVQLDTRSPAMEWCMAPVLLFAGTERWLWLGNAACFAALPGLIFSIGVALGGRPRALYAWMWLLPTGFVFLLQAGGLANDLPGTFFLLAALALALRARQRRHPGDLLLSLLAAALATGVKMSNAPLLLPWALVFGRSLPLLRQAPVRSTMAVLAALACSFLPQALINHAHVREWTGATAELGAEIAQGSHPVRVAGNLLGLTVQNASPPIFPVAGAWNSAAERLLPERFKHALAGAFEGGGRMWRANELPYEDWAPMGATLALLLGASLLAAVRAPGSSSGESAWHRLVVWSPWVAFAVFLWQLNLLSVGRLAAPYYLLLPLPLLLQPCQSATVRTRWWRALAFLHSGTAAVVLILAPSRPLWPALTTLRILSARSPGQAALGRIEAVYTVYRERAEAFAPVSAALPPSSSPVAVCSGNDPLASLLRPFGARAFYLVRPGVSAAELQTRGVEYVILSEDSLQQHGFTLPAWLAWQGAELTSTHRLRLRASGEAGTWHVARLMPHSAALPNCPAAQLSQNPPWIP